MSNNKRPWVLLLFLQNNNRLPLDINLALPNTRTSQTDTLQSCLACPRIQLSDGTFGRLLAKKTLMIKSVRALIVKSQFSVLMNCVPLIAESTLFMNINHRLPGSWARPLLSSLGLLWACVGRIRTKVSSL